MNTIRASLARPQNPEERKNIDSAIAPFSRVFHEIRTRCTLCRDQSDSTIRLKRVVSMKVARTLRTQGRVCIANTEADGVRQRRRWSAPKNNIVKK